jgi:hypothetical protein
LNSHFPIGFLLFSWILLLVPIWIFNLLFMDNKSKDKIVAILQEGIGLNPFNRIFFRRTPIQLIKVFGAIIGVFYLSIICDLIQYAPSQEVSYRLINVIVYFLANLILQSWVLYFLHRIKTAFDSGRLQQGLLYEEVASVMGAMPRWSFLAIFVAQTLIYSIFLIKILW